MLTIEAQHDYLARAIRGHCAYYGRAGNGKRLEWFRYQVARTWRKWLARRSRLRRMNWDRMNELPNGIPCHRSRSRAHCKTPCANLSGEEPSASVAHARLCGGRRSVTTPPTRPTRAHLRARTLPDPGEMRQAVYAEGLPLTRQRVPSFGSREPGLRRDTRRADPGGAVRSGAGADRCSRLTCSVSLGTRRVPEHPTLDVVG